MMITDSNDNNRRDTLELLFLGGVFPPEDESALRAMTRAQLQYAANHFQLALLDGFIQDPRIHKVTLLNAPFIGSWPRLSRILHFKRHKDYYFHEVEHHPLPFWNLFALKQVDRFFHVIFALLRHLHSRGVEAPQALLVYSAHTPFLWGAILARWMVRSPAPLWLVLPDLPEFTDLSQHTGLLYRILKWFDIRLFNQACKQVNAFVVLTEAMLDKIHSISKPSLVIEGIYRPMEPENVTLLTAERPSHAGSRFFYAGGLFKAYGIDSLVTTFRRLEYPDAQLYLAGMGESVPFIELHSAQDPRIHYLGQISSRSAREWQKRVHFLVNPRSGSNEFTKYSFPSKIIEYFASGTPTLMCPLPGVPDEYRQLAIMTENGSEEALLQALRRACSMPEAERQALGAAARDFILTHKSIRNQCDRLLSAFLSTVS